MILFLGSRCISKNILSKHVFFGFSSQAEWFSSQTAREKLESLIIFRARVVILELELQKPCKNQARKALQKSGECSSRNAYNYPIESITQLEIDFWFLPNQPKSNYIFHFPIDFEPIKIQFFFRINLKLMKTILL